MLRLLTICYLAGSVFARPVLEIRHSQNTTSTAPAATSQATSAHHETSGAAVQLQPSNPFSFPISNGFPDLSDTAKAQVNVLAQGIIPNGGAPTFDADTILSFQLIAFNEIWEIAFFTSLLSNLTNDVDGFAITDAASKATMVKALTAIIAQEESHAVAANTFLQANGAAPIEACQYQFPTSTLVDAISLASTFTDVILGTLSEVQFGLASSAVKGAAVAGVVPIIGSVLGNEAEQNGFFRAVSGNLLH